MKMKVKRTYVIGLLLLLAAGLAIGGTLAFMTDAEAKVNVFVVGNVNIKLNEDFIDRSKLMPGIKVDKKVTIENTGRYDAWVWFTYAVPADMDAALEIEMGEAPWLSRFLVKENVAVEEGSDKLYNVYGALYKEKLAPGAETNPSMLSVALSGKVNIQNGQYVLYEDGVYKELPTDSLREVKVIVSGYAIQVDGFESVEEGYAAYHEQWEIEQDVPPVG